MKLIKRIKAVMDLLSMKCPSCGGKMKAPYFDSCIDSLIWECTKCKKLYL